MKPFKTIGSLMLLTSTLILATSCSKNMDEQMTKGENEVGKFNGGNCAPFLGIQTRQNNPAATFAYLGEFNAALETQPFYESTFSANNLLHFSATNGSPFYDPQFIRIGVNDQWIDLGEVLSLKIQNGKAAKKMQMQFRTLNTGVAGTANFFLAGIKVGSTSITSAPGPISGFLIYEATGDNKEFDEVQFSVSSGKLAITGFTPNLVGGGQSGFHLVETPGDRVALRLKTGVTNIAGTDYPNQYFTWTTNFVDGPAGWRQNRVDLPSLAAGSGEFTNAGSPVIPGSKTYVNIKAIGDNGLLCFRYDNNPANFRFGVGDQFIGTQESIEITPGVDFPGTKFRMVEVRSATLKGAKIKVDVYNGGTWVSSNVSSGADKNWVLVTSKTEFNKVIITNYYDFTSDASIGRVTPGLVGGAILLYPSCP